MQYAKRHPIGEHIDRLAMWVRPWIPMTPGIHRLLRKLRARLPAARSTPTTQLMEAFGSAFPRAFFIQIGANDGATSDPLRRQIAAHDWRGIMVEPVPHIFRKLQANSAGVRNIILENIAVGAQDGEAEFHSLTPVDNPTANGLPHWYAGLGSFRLDVILSHKHLIPDIEERVVTQKLPCLTFNTLCERHKVDKIDLVQIDTEGYDYEVVKLIDLQRFQPTLIVYEHAHLNPEDRSACEQHLREQGYEVASFHLDTLAMRVSNAQTQHPALVRTWHALFPAAK